MIRNLPVEKHRAKEQTGIVKVIAGRWSNRNHHDNTHAGGQTVQQSIRCQKLAIPLCIGEKIRSDEQRADEAEAYDPANYLLFREDDPVENTENGVEKSRLKPCHTKSFQAFEKIVFAVSIFQSLIEESQCPKIVCLILFHNQILPMLQKTTPKKTDSPSRYSVMLEKSSGKIKIPHSKCIYSKRQTNKAILPDNSASAGY